MGWISDRHMKRGGSIGGKRKGRVYPKTGAPLRKIVATVIRSGNMFVADTVRLECGHETTSWGGIRARCQNCQQRPCDAAKGDV